MLKLGLNFKISKFLNKFVSEYLNFLTKLAFSMCGERLFSTID
jgi:hypothetical protein